MRRHHRVPSPLSNALQQHDGTVLAHIDSAVTNPNTSDASGILSHVLGSNQGEIERTVSAGTGLDAGMLLQILAPLVMGALGKQMRDRQMNPARLRARFRTSSSSINSRMAA